MIVDLYESKQAVFAINASGLTNDTSAECEIRNDIYGTEWTFKTVVITTNSPQTYGQSRFLLYLNVKTPGGIRDSTYLGDGSTSETNIRMRAGDRLIAHWDGGDAGSYATVTIHGDKETGR
jgi:hypothetical protein